ncbi:AAA family ATPase [Patescibacteria group bacterium]|nr:AAA family ATPase [Patescibacteria group bacterium]
MTADLEELEKQLQEKNQKIEEKEQSIKKKNNLILELHVEIERLREFLKPPNPCAVFVRLVSERSFEKAEEGTRGKDIPARVEISDPAHAGRHMIARVDFSVDEKKLRRGQRLVLSPQYNVVEALNEFIAVGNVGTVGNVLPDRRVIVSTSLEESMVFSLADSVEESQVRLGARVLYDSATRYVLEVVDQEKKSSLQMEEVKLVTYDQIGGLGEQIKEFEEHIILPRLNPKIFRKYETDLPKGAAFYGPPGCGKTLLARAVAYRIKNDLKREVALFVGSGPEFLIKWVGDSEHKVREPAEYAKSHPETIVLYVVDEIDAIGRTRGSPGGHAGVNDSIVTQFNTILDGFVEIPNLIFIGITNRLDLIDSSMLRPGRLDLQLKISRPDKESAAGILRIYLTKSLPFHEKYFDREKYPELNGNQQCIVDYFIEETLKHIYGNGTKNGHETRKVATIEFSDTGEEVILYMKDFVSGALLKDIVNKAKLKAALAEFNGEEPGIRLKFLHDQIDMEFNKLIDQINRTHSEEWARMADLPVDKPFRVLQAAEADKKTQSDFSSKA